MEKNEELRLAILIDADNVPSSNIKGMLEEVAKYGIPTFKRIYGDWTKPTIARWKSVLLENAITPIQQYSYTTGKNATDAAMIIDAMDILYTGRVGGFCLVSSDSDFTRLATRLREAGMRVIGMGEKKTPAPFISACDKFIYIEILDIAAAEETTEGKRRTPQQKSATIQKLNKEIIHLMETTVNDLADESGWAFLGEVGAMLLKKQPDFDPRNYGFNKLLPFIKSTGRFDIDARQTDRGNIKLIYVKTKQ